MFGPPVQGWYVFLAVAIASFAIAGITLEMVPTAEPPATAVAETVDEVAAGSAPAVGRYPLTTGQIKVESHAIAVRQEGETGQANYRFGPVVAAGHNESLQQVLEGVPPEQAFQSPSEFATAIEQANDQEPAWESVTDGIIIRSVRWGETDVTLVGT